MNSTDSLEHHAARIARLDSAWTINELLRRSPSAAAVLHAFGIDTCCGGARSLARAAADEAIDLDTLLNALADARVTAER